MSRAKPSRHLVRTSDPRPQTKQVILVGEEDDSQIPVAQTASGWSMLSPLARRSRMENLECNDTKETIARLGLTDEEVARAMDVFHMVDTDKDESVDVNEFFTFLNAIAHTSLTDEDREQIEQTFLAIGSESLDFPQFLEAYCNSGSHKNRNVENMLKQLVQSTAIGADPSTREAELRVRFAGVPVRYIHQYIDDELQEMSACLKLPSVVLMFVAFILAVNFHERTEVINGQEEALIFDLEENAVFAFAEPIPFDSPRMGHKNLYDVNTFADFWSWLNLGLVPLLWEEVWAKSESRSNVYSRCETSEELLWNFAYDISSNMSGPQAALSGECPERQLQPEVVKNWYGEPKSHTHLWFNAVVGGARLEQEKGVITECPGEAVFGKKLYTGMCVETSEYWIEPQKTEFGARDKTRINLPGAETNYLLKGRPQRKIRQQLNELEDRAWFNPMTSKVNLLFTTYNAHLHLMQITQVIVYVNNAGHFHRMIIPTSIWLDPYHGWWCYVADVVWLCCVFMVVVETVAEFRGMLKKRNAKLTAGERRLVYAAFFKLSNIVDTLMTALALSIVAFWVAHMAELHQLTDLLKKAESGREGTWADPSDREAYFELVFDMAQSSQTRTAMYALYPFALVTRFFEVCAGQPRLALVTRTLQNAADDVFHFGCVFIFVFSVFSSCAMILFGRSIPDFATFGRATDTSFHILLGDWDWSEMREIGRIRASLWFWTFIWLMHLLMFNMLLAIMMDVYTDTRGSLDTDAETLWSQVQEIWQRWRRTRAGLRLPLDQVKEHLVLWEESCGVRIRTSTRTMTGNTETPMNMKMFMSAVPGLGQEQAMRILSHSWSHFRKELQSQTSHTMADTLVRVVENSMESIHNSLDSLRIISDKNMQLLQSNFGRHSLHTQENHQDDMPEALKENHQDDVPDWFSWFIGQRSDAFLPSEGVPQWFLNYIAQNGYALEAKPVSPSTSVKMPSSLSDKDCRNVSGVALSALETDAANADSWGSTICPRDQESQEPEVSNL
eukprot:TRINITY_DN23616_c0_g2_i2.p1 TRINITY_DN23616_c0_g2~~TRINITY_DN23616_c0_g2_i2.p1  ORF type:complete len:1013 (+),score=161.72 TRINITY_DN23616_c0_g2_i2:45-3083(+)